MEISGLQCGLLAAMVCMVHKEAHAIQVVLLLRINKCRVFS